MNLGYARGYQITQQLDMLEDYPVDELFSDGAQEVEALNSPTSEFQALLSFAQPGDHLVLASWEVISRDYRQLLACLEQLETLEVTLDVLNLPQLSIEEWREIFRWSLRNDRLLHPILVRAGKERDRSKDAYSLFSKEPEARKLYREIIWLLVEKNSVRQVAQQKRVPIETTYRIQQELKQLQLAIILVICFLLAIFSIKLAESYFDQLWIQVAICVIVTLVILWNVLIDTEESEAKPPTKEKKVSKT
ncbi:recombinase family protein [Candidatus Enterococcus ferrettii]|uniref:Resolvase/invertase-type recombinase catalytic domain-containing protein n=1 Tax=Candidatus Enterococcus ferrettii TaxID=2815324 RepID=A0ABV0EJN9_9ENTE|nr:recombinase family protein [Enterococcus sp. 665A]MBO1339033.1 recombinase family protein [Enterococcus sp. 665A]